MIDYLEAIREYLTNKIGNGAFSKLILSAISNLLLNE